MRQIKAAITGILTLLAAATASAQTFPTVPSGTVIGRTAVGTGPSQAIPITQLIASMVNPLTVTSVNTASVVYRGATSGTATVTAQAVAGTPTILLPNTSGTLVDNATLPLAIDAATGNVSCPACITGMANGQLQYNSTTSIIFMPWNGDQVRIQGVLYRIPAAGVSCGNPTSVFLNGTAAQTLAINTTYYVYVFNNSGTLACDFSTTAYAVDTTTGNIGTVIKSATQSRTLIGMIRTAATVNYVNTAAKRYVRSWFNDPGIYSFNNFTVTRTSAATGSFTEVNSEIRIEALIWTNETWDVSANMSGFGNSAINSNSFSSIAFNGTTAEPNGVLMTIPNLAGLGGFSVGASARAMKTGLTEGFNYATIVGKVDTGTASWNSSADGNRTILSGRTSIP